MSEANLQRRHRRPGVTKSHMTDKKKKRVEDEMISGLRLKALGLTGYVLFVGFLLLSLALEFHLLDLFMNNDGTLSLYLSELFLIILPIAGAGLYYLIFRVLLRQSKKEQAL